jgi:ribonuclease III
MKPGTPEEGGEPEISKGRPLRAVRRGWVVFRVRRSSRRTWAIRFGNLDLLELALTHPSITHDMGAGTPHNQRLEFLGDAVLQLVLTLELYEKFPDLGEGPLTQARAEMVNRRTLAVQSRAMNVGEFLRMSRSEETTGGRDRSSALADAFEAVVGAIFLDGGLPAARRFVLQRFREAFGQLEALPSFHNPKGDLQELLQAESAEAAGVPVDRGERPGS